MHLHREAHNGRLLLGGLLCRRQTGHLRPKRRHLRLVPRHALSLGCLLCDCQRGWTAMLSDGQPIGAGWSTRSGCTEAMQGPRVSPV